MSANGFFGIRYRKSDKITLINESDPDIIGGKISKFCKRNMHTIPKCALSYNYAFHLKNNFMYFLAVLGLHCRVVFL